ncbi:MAG: hypothetical protein HYX87_07025 [Chloroflexi bacterium]|nr:hypothetical protein [Chloroflexota bacterium]
MLPKELEDGFRKAGIDNINDPRFGAWVDTPQHHEMHKDCVDTWQKFFDKFEDAHKTPTPEDILNEAQRLAGQYQFAVNFIAPRRWRFL